MMGRIFVLHKKNQATKMADYTPICANDKQKNLFKRMNYVTFKTQRHICLHVCV